MSEPFAALIAIANTKGGCAKSTTTVNWARLQRPHLPRLIKLIGHRRPRVKMLNRILCEAGIIVMRDSPTGKRCGRRGPEGATAARLMEESTKAREPSPMPLRRSPGVVTHHRARVPIRSRKQHVPTRRTRAGHDGRQVRAESINKDEETAALQ
jgi:hypothetical protein